MRRHRIPDDELEFRATKSGGPGGQHVNTSSTKAELRWRVAASRAFDAAEKSRIAARLASRIDSDGWLRIVSSETRSQFGNRERARERLEALVADAVRPPKPRRPTGIPAAERRRRLEAKRRRGTVKRDRRRPDGDE